MLNWFRKRDEVSKFWRWFEKNAAAIRHGVKHQDHALIVHELGRRLSKVNSTVVHEIGMADTDTVELIISADGMREAMPAVLTLAKQAPRLPGFLITAFRPRWPKPGLGILDRHVDGEDVRYFSETDGERLHLKVFLRGNWTQQQRSMIGFLMLDQTLGEYDVMTGLGAIEFEEGEPADALPLASLVQEFDALRGATKH